MKMNLDTLQKVFELMKNYDVLELRDADEFCITMRPEKANEKVLLTPEVMEASAGIAEPNEAEKFMVETLAKASEVFNSSSDEDILMDPYHGLEEMRFENKKEKQKGESK